jgi:hypothetical protein
MVIMRFGRAFSVASLLVGSAFAQSALAQNLEDELKTKIVGLHYMPLAEAARVQGDVRLNISGGVVSVLSGPPLLVKTAVENAKAIASIEGASALNLTYHFVLSVGTVSVPTWTTVKKGNTVERTVLRIFGRKAEKQVLISVCKKGIAPASTFKIAGVAVEIWIYGRDTCLETEASTLVARR